ncbi:hypothetical protein BJ508DRAFT_344873 [Ascobolus immersus RN42]|uniref:Uncharacterized protein n=1 Tax=Ascobolus immersus RN42 TaxID=1160509 RepID=A0A3N4ILI1_ASCIM|nr:hypothetical protein BJ508DRAFT_344873 [Ascobolus immersus RN42]
MSKTPYVLPGLPNCIMIDLPNDRIVPARYGGTKVIRVQTLEEEQSIKAQATVGKFGMVVRNPEIARLPFRRKLRRKRPQFVRTFERMGKSGWDDYAIECWPKDHLELPVRIDEDGQIARILHSLIDKYRGNDLNQVNFPKEEAYTKYFDDKVFKALRKQFPDIDQEVEKAEDQIRAFQAHHKYSSDQTRSLLPIGRLDKQGQSLVFLAEEFEASEVGYDLRRSIMVKHQMALSSRVARMEDTLMKCFEDDDLAADKIYFIMKLAYVRMSKRREFNVPRLLSVDMTPSSVAPRSGKEFIDLLKQYCATLTAAGHPRAEILNDVFSKALVGSRTRAERKKFSELQNIAVMSHGLFGAYFFLETMELWEFILIPEDHQLYDYSKDFMQKYLDEKELSPVDGPRRIPKMELQEILDSLKDDQELQKKKKKSGNKKKKKKASVPEDDTAAGDEQQEAPKISEKPQTFAEQFGEQRMKNVPASKAGDEPVTQTSFKRLLNPRELPAPEPKPEPLSEEARQAIIDELLAMDNVQAEKPQAAPKKKKKTVRAGKKANGKSKTVATSVADDSDDSDTDAKPRNETPVSSQLSDREAPTDGWKVVTLPKRVVKETKPPWKQRFGNARRDAQVQKSGIETPAAVAASPKLNSKAVPKAVEQTKPPEPIKPTLEQTKYRAALLKPVDPKMQKNDRNAAAELATTSKGKVPEKAKPLVRSESPKPKPKPEALSRKEIDDLSEFPVLAVAKDNSSVKSVGTLRIVTAPVSNAPPDQHKTINKSEHVAPPTNKLNDSSATIDVESTTLPDANEASPPISKVHADSKEPVVQSDQQPIAQTAEKKKKKRKARKPQDGNRKEAKSAGPSREAEETPVSDPPVTPQTSAQQKSTPEPSEMEKSIPAASGQDANHLGKTVAEVIEKASTSIPQDSAFDTQKILTEAETNPPIDEHLQDAEAKAVCVETVDDKEDSEEPTSAVAEATGVSETSSLVDGPVADEVDIMMPRAEMEEASFIPSAHESPNAEVTAIVPKSSQAGDYFVGPNQIRFGSLIVEQAPPSLAGSPLAVRWGDSELDSDDELTELDVEPNYQPSKLSHEVTMNSLAAEEHARSEQYKEWLEKYYDPVDGVNMSLSPITPKPGPIVPLKSAFRRSEDNAIPADQVSPNWPAPVDAVPALEKNIKSPRPVGIQITVSAPPSPGPMPSVAVQHSITQQGSATISTMDGADDGSRPPTTATGEKEQPDVIQVNGHIDPKDTLKVPEPIPSAVYTTEPVSHGVCLPEPTQTLPYSGQPYPFVGQQDGNPQTNGASLSLRDHVFACPCCKKSLRHRCSIVCPGCGPAANVRFCSRDCLFGAHEHWKDCGKLMFNQPLCDGMLSNYEPMPASQTPWRSAELWRQSLNLWEEEDNVDYFIFNTETGELVGHVLHVNLSEHDRHRFRSLRDNCIKYQDVDQVGLLFRALWHQCQYQGISVGKIELRHQLALEYGHDIPSVYIPPISEYEWSLAGYGFEGHGHGAQFYGYPGPMYFSNGYMPPPFNG